MGCLFLEKVFRTPKCHYSFSYAESRQSDLKIKNLSPHEVEAVQYLHSTYFPLWFRVLGSY